MWIVIVGTRPEAVKLEPVCLALQTQSVPFQVMMTGQQPDLGADVYQRFRAFPCHRLQHPARVDPFYYADGLRHGIRPLLRAIGPLGVLVQGDTASAYAGAWAASQEDIDVCHVEAGLRTYDDTQPYPEERMRVQISRWASRHCCPTLGNQANLAAEGRFQTHVTGNPITDALRLAGVQRQQDRAGILVTCHRRENLPHVQQIARGLQLLAEAEPVTLIRHYNQTNTGLRQHLNGSVPSIDALPYPELLNLLSRSRLVVTDSGGLVEEATTLGIPSLVLREKTERPEAVEVGSSVLVGTDPERLLSAYHSLPNPDPSSVFGDGYCAERIAQLLTL